MQHIICLISLFVNQNQRCLVSPQISRKFLLPINWRLTYKKAVNAFFSEFLSWTSFTLLLQIKLLKIILSLNFIDKKVGTQLEVPFIAGPIFDLRLLILAFRYQWYHIICQPLLRRVFVRRNIFDFKRNFQSKNAIVNLKNLWNAKFDSEDHGRFLLRKFKKFSEFENYEVKLTIVEIRKRFIYVASLSINAIGFERFIRLKWF